MPTKEKAEQLIKKIKGGAKFEDLAKAESTDNSKANGGDLGWFTTARMVKPFGDAVKGLKKGDFTAEPVQTQYGWHIIKLRIRATRPFDQMKPQLTKPIMQKKFQDLYRRPEEDRQDRKERSDDHLTGNEVADSLADPLLLLQHFQETPFHRAPRTPSCWAFSSLDPASAPATT